MQWSNCAVSGSEACVRDTLTRIDEHFRRRRRLAATSAHELWEVVGARTGRRGVMKVARAGDVAREAEMLRRAAGDGVVALLAHPDPTRLVMARVAGPTLAEVLARRRLGTRQVRALALRLGGVLVRVHRAGVVHGDVSPDNVILVGGDPSRATLVDFDTARAAGTPFGPRVTAAFTAPERLAGPCDADPRADVFSLGALLAACRIQRSPFEEETRDATVLRVLVVDPPRPRGAGTAEARALRAMLQKDPALRPADARTAVAALLAPRGGAAASMDLRLGVVRPEDAGAPYAALAPALRAALALEADVPFADARAAVRKVLPRRDAHLADVAVGVIAPAAAPPSSLTPLLLDPALRRAHKHQAALAVTSALMARGAPLRVRGHLDPATREVVDALGGAASVAPSSRALPPSSRATRDPVRARAVTHALGGAFDAELFAEVMGVPGSEAATMLDMLAAEGSVARDALDAYREAGEAGRSAYGMLSEPERRRVHARIAAALSAVAPEAHGRRATHLAAAGSFLRAAHEYDLAAQSALEASDLAGAARWLDAAERVLAAAPTSAASRLLRGMVDLHRAQGQRWTGENAQAGSRARAALARLPAGSSAWCEALGERATAAGKLGDLAEVLAVAAGLHVAPVSEHAAFAWDRACARTAVQLFFHGEVPRARALTRLFLRRTVRADGTPDERRRGLSPGALVTEAVFSGRLDEYLARLRAGVAQFGALGDERSACMYGASVGYACAQLGDFARAERSLRGVMARAEAAGLPMLVTLARHNLGLALTYRPGAIEEAVAVESTAIDALRTQGDLRYLAGSLAYRARMHVARGDARLAEADAREAVQIAARVAAVEPLAWGALAEALLLAHEPDEALAAAEDARRAMDWAGPGESHEALVWLAAARALETLGRREEARREIAAACAGIRARARRIRSPSWRARFLRSAPDHAATFALARALRAAARP